MTYRQLTLTNGKLRNLIGRAIKTDPRLASPHTVRGYGRDLEAFEDWRGGRPMTKLLVEAYAAHLREEGKSPATINRTLSAIRWWARKVADLALEDATLGKATREEVALQAERVAQVKGVRATKTEKGRHLTAGELKALIDACAKDSSPAGIRDAAILALAWATGPRRAELASLQVRDYEPNADGEATITYRKAKGGKTRKLWVYNGAADALADWLSIRGDEPGPLFLAINKAGAMHDHGLSGEALRLMLAKRQEQAGITRPTTWHDFRRTFVGNIIEAEDLSTARILAGHERADTTALYDRRGEEIRRRALRSLHVPYRRRQAPE